MDAKNWLKSMRIGVALRALRELIDNPEDTPRVFEIVRALGRPALKRSLRRFRTTEVGRRVLRDRVDLIDTLRDRESLAAMPLRHPRAHLLRLHLRRVAVRRRTRRR